MRVPSIILETSYVDETNSVYLLLLLRSFIDPRPSGGRQSYGGRQDNYDNKR